MPAIGTKIASKANREGGAERCDDPAVHKTIAVDLALITSDDPLRSTLELFLLKTAKQHDVHTRYLLQTVPGIGKMLRLVLLDEMHHIDRVLRVQDFASYGRLITWAKASGGKRCGTSGHEGGNAHLTWAFSKAATLFRRGPEPGHKYLAKLEKKHDQGKALRIVAHKLARAVSCMLKRHTALDLEPFLCASGRSAGEPGASLDTVGRSLHTADLKPHMAASWNAAVRRGPLSLSPARGLDTRSGSWRSGA